MLAALFLLLAPAQAGAPTCTRTLKLTASSGDFTDGSASSKPYDNNLDTCWFIAPTLDDGQRVALTFKRVDIEEEVDFLEVFELGKKPATSTDAAPKTVFTSTTGFLLHFHTDESVVRTGFSASFSTEKGADQEDDLLPLLDEEPW